MPDDYGETIVNTDDPQELLDQLGMGKQKAPEERGLPFAPPAGQGRTSLDVGEVLKKRNEGIGMETLGDGGKVLHEPPPAAPPIDLGMVNADTDITPTAEQPVISDEEDEPELGEGVVVGDVLADDDVVDAFLEAGSVEDLKEALTKPYTEEFVVRVPGAKPMKVMIAPINTARMATMREYMKVWRDSRGDKIAEEARNLVLYVINGTVKPQLKVDHKEWLLSLPWQTINDWAEAIQRVSSILQQIDWDDRAQDISEDTCQTLEAGLKRAFVNPFEDGLPSGVNENNLAAYMENIIGSLMVAVGPLVNIAIHRAQALGQDRFCHGDRGAPKRDELKND